MKTELSQLCATVEGHLTLERKGGEASFQGKF